MTINAKTLEVFEELGSISDDLNIVWCELSQLSLEKTLPMRMKLNNIDKRVLKVADMIDLTKPITR